MCSDLANVFGLWRVELGLATIMKQSLHTKQPPKRNQLKTEVSRLLILQEKACPLQKQNSMQNAPYLHSQVFSLGGPSRSMRFLLPTVEASTASHADDTLI